jgi:hypothetical protein
MVFFNLSLQLSIILLMVVLAPTTATAAGMSSGGSGTLQLKYRAHTAYENGDYTQAIFLYKKILKILKFSRILGVLKMNLGTSQVPYYFIREP